MNESSTNRFTINIFTINGTGSMSSNNLLAKSLFRCGLTVVPKNHFPSNIAGAATSFTIRVTDTGKMAFVDSDDILVLMNPNTYTSDLQRLQKGGVVFYNPKGITIPEEIEGSPDYTVYKVPLDDIARAEFSDIKLRNLMKNMIMVGAVMGSLGIEHDIIAELIQDTFNNKQAVIDANLKAVDLGIDYFKNELGKKDPYRVEKRPPHKDKILIDGNTASALGAIQAGCTFAAWYPITPSSSLMEGVERLGTRYRKREDGSLNFAIIQAEDEISAVGMIAGAGFAGGRSMTATSGPGLSLMSEILGLCFYSEIPCVVADVQRAGPSTGLPTRTQQGDLLFAANISHGDTRHPMLFPHDPGECYSMMIQAFDYAEAFQTPVLFMSDLDVGMNQWMTDEIKYEAVPHNRGKIVSPEQLEELGTRYGRYRDLDGDGIPYRTIPGNPHPRARYFLRGSGHNEDARYTESDQTYEAMMNRFNRKWETIRSQMPAPVLHVDKGSDVGILAIGTSHYAVMEALERMAQSGTTLDYMRIRAFPFNGQVKDFLTSHKTVLVVDQNTTGQLKSLLDATYPGSVSHARSVAISTGKPLATDRLVHELKVRLEN